MMTSNSVCTTDKPYLSYILHTLRLLFACHLWAATSLRCDRYNLSYITWWHSFCKV